MTNRAAVDVVHAADARHMQAATPASEKSEFATPGFTRNDHLRFSILTSTSPAAASLQFLFNSQIRPYAVIRLTKPGDGNLERRLLSGPHHRLVCSSRQIIGADWGRIMTRVVDGLVEPQDGTLWATSDGGEKGGHFMDDRLKQLIAEFSGAVKDSLLESDRIAGVVAKIRAGGHDVLLVLSATIGLTERSEQSEAQAAPTSAQAEFSFSSQDAKFLKAMHISLGK